MFPKISYYVVCTFVIHWLPLASVKDTCPVLVLPTVLYDTLVVIQYTYRLIFFFLGLAYLKRYFGTPDPIAFIGNSN